MPLSARSCRSRVAVAFNAPVMTMYFMALMSPAYDKATAIRSTCGGKYEPNSGRFRLRGETWVETETVQVSLKKESPDRPYERSGA
jgi:hypothetical protein